MEDCIALRCRCGQVRGRVHRVDTARYGVCYCGDCQAYAHALGEPAGTLDEHGGTAVVQVGPSRVQITDGIANIAVLRLSPKGLFRWYASCCDTPIANTMPSPKMPFVGLVHTCWAPEGIAAVGPPSFRINLPKPPPGDLRDEHVLRAVGRVAAMMLGERLSGRYRRNPFFGADGAPITAPRVVPLDEVNAARAAVQAARR